MGKIEESLIGSTVERVARKVRKDILVVSNANIKRIVVGIDGSELSFFALEKAILFSKIFNVEM